MNDAVAIAFGEEIQKIAEYVGSQVEAAPDVQKLFGVKRPPPERKTKEVGVERRELTDRGQRGTATAFDTDKSGWMDKEHLVNPG